MTRKKTKQITLIDVAKDAGVSKTTASLVVRGSSLISESTSKKVLDSIKKLGYVYNRIAANLRSQSTSTVGVIINDIGNPFFSELLVGINDELDKHGYTVLLGTTFDSKLKQDRLIDKMLENKICGLVLFPVEGTSEKNLDNLQNFHIPIVLVGRYIKNYSIDYVGPDNILSLQIAVQHLIENGYHRIAFLGGGSTISTYADRLEGYKTALRYNNIPFDESMIIKSPTTREGGRQAIAQILKHPNPPTAIACYNDIVALGVILQLKLSGLTVGKDIAISGCDNIQESEYSHPSLTTVSTNIRQMGREAARLLNKRILGDEEDPIKVIVPSKLIIRDSSVGIQKPIQINL